MYRMNTGYTVAYALTQEPVTISPLRSLRDAAKAMAKEHVGALLVRDKETLLGIITEQDIVRKGVAASGNAALRKVRDIMAANLITIEPDEDIFEALRIMRDENIRHLPVFNQGKFVGLVTLKIEPDLYEILVEKIELREAQRKLSHKRTN